MVLQRRAVRVIKIKLSDIKRIHLILSLITLLVLTLLISISIFFIKEGGNREYIVYFPHAKIENKLVAQSRYAIREKSRENKVKELVKQLGLGPSNELRVDCHSIFPQGMEAKSVIFDKKKVFIELPTDFILIESEMPYEVDRSIEVLKYNIHQNFNWISYLIVTVNEVELLNCSLEPKVKVDSKINDDVPVKEEESK